MRDKNIDHPSWVGTLKDCQPHEVSPIAHGSNGRCVNGEALAKPKKNLKRLAKTKRALSGPPGSSADMLPKSHVSRTLYAFLRPYGLLFRERDRNGFPI
jgi:hypothetical protein